MVKKSTVLMTGICIAAAALAVAVLSVPGFSGIAPAAGAPVDIVPHKALYEMRMISAESGSGIVGLDGTMYYEQDDACDAWTTDQRFTVEYQYPERAPLVNSSHYVSWETKEGGQFEFNSRRQENGQPAELLRGSVVTNAEGEARAQYTRPADLSYDLPEGYLLPVSHTQELLRRARAGETLFNAVLFDGTDADGPVEMNAVIGRQLDAVEIETHAKNGKIDKSLLTSAWHFRIAVFPLKDANSVLPAYEMDMVMHDNGIVSRSVVDYRTFRVEQSLVSLEKLPEKECP